MTSSRQIWDLRGIKIYIFGKHMTIAIQKYNKNAILSILDKYLTTFWHGLLLNMAMSHDSG